MASSSTGPSTVHRPMFTYRDELALVHHLIDVLERRLGGRHESRFLRTLPSDHCHLGVLGPRDPDIEQPEPLERAEGDEVTQQPSPAPTQQTRRGASAPTARTVAPGDDNPDELGELADSQIEQRDAERRNGGRDSTRRPPSSLGLEIVVAPDSTSRDVEFLIEGQFAVYTQHFPTYDEQVGELGSASLLRNEDAVGAAGQAGTLDIPAPKTLPATTGQTSHPRSRVSLVEAYERHIVSLPPIHLTIDPGVANRLTDRGQWQQALDHALDVAVQSPTIWRELTAPPMVPADALYTPERYQAYVRSIGGGRVIRPPLRISLDVRVVPLPGGHSRVSCYLRNDTSRDPIKRYLDQYHILADTQLHATLVRGQLHPVELLPAPQDYQFDRRVWAVGHGASAVVSADRRAIRTEALARYEQVRRTTSRRASANFDDLITDQFGTLERIRHAMRDYAAAWEADILGRNTRGLTDEELVQCRQDLAAFVNEEAQFAAGIAALKMDARLLQAFTSMNKVFRRTSRGRYDCWHLFQIVFIVSQLPALAVREGIEAGEWPVGVRRTWEDALEYADVLWFPTGGGKTEAYLGLICCAVLYDRLRGKHFGVTAWLRFPLRMLSVQQLQRAVVVLWETEQERRAILGDRAHDSDPVSLGYFVGKESTPNILYLSGQDKWTFSRLEQDPRTRRRLLLVSDCPACLGVGTVDIALDREATRIRHLCAQCESELPVYVSDDEIFRFLPSVIVGTIDKMAAIAYQDKFALLWGGAAWQCPVHPEHGYGMGDWCVSNCSTNPRSGRNRPTARRPVRPYDPAPSLHIQDELHLLQEELGAFAGHYETLVRECEATIGGRPPKTVAATATIEGFEHQVRHIYGLPHARRFPGRGYDRFETFYTTADRDASDSGRPSKVARIYVAFRPPHLHAADAASLCTQLLNEELNSLYDHPYEAAAWLVDAQTEQEVRALLHYYGTTLTYVGSKPHGVRVRQALEREAGRLRPGGIRDLTTELLTGQSSLAEIADTVRRLESPADRASEAYLDATVATSVISHGVDVERLNVMVMDGIPDESAQYIQASSRSGRRHVGLVLATLASYSIRASSIYHRFPEYHEHLDRLVSPVPVNRFAKYAVRRTAPGILIGLLLGRYGPALKLQLKQRDIAASLFAPSNPRSLSSHMSAEEFQEAVARAYALGKGVYATGLELAMREALDDQVGQFIFTILGSHHQKVSDAWLKPMTSLRDVDEGVRFQPSDQVDWQELRWFDTQRR